MGAIPAEQLLPLLPLLSFTKMQALLSNLPGANSPLFSPMQSSRAHSGGAFRHRDMGFIFFNEEKNQMEFMSSDNTGNSMSQFM